MMVEQEYRILVTMKAEWQKLDGEKGWESEDACFTRLWLTKEVLQDEQETVIELQLKSSVMQLPGFWNRHWKHKWEVLG